ncbi:FadR family transcriptional regulator [Halomonas sp. M5N1S17]|uniref:FadR/GntR family transcriptional regulator n=1 Tax=Halomonas alkalisoli TaxID=2907158 RepID=UPI001F175ED4|nr:FadR/GntR family transcriptional regulator [Halomonas alkalisoli]MCE9663514.1 FadR family transcriptional regulator [Halomonas alkalisoli]
MSDRREPTSGRRSLGEMVYDHLQRAIKSGSYQPDERLPTEHELAAEFQVSRPIVRDALQKLREQGLIYSRRGAGSFVRSLGLRQPLGFGQMENIADLEDCYEFRLSVEPRAAARAAERHNAEDLQRIKSALKMLRDATSRRRHHEDADFQFHLAISQASGNRYYATAMEALEEHIAVGMQLHGLSLKTTPDGLQHVFEEHRAIAEAIEQRHPELAHDLMHKHLAGSRDRLFEGKRRATASSSMSATM